jgi:hypothetical protein
MTSVGCGVTDDAPRHWLKRCGITCHMGIQNDDDNDDDNGNDDVSLGDCFSPQL